MALSGNSSSQSRPGVSASAPEVVVSGVLGTDLQLRRMRGDDVARVMEIEAVSFGHHHWSDDSFHNELSNQLGLYYSLFDTHPERLTPEGEPTLVGYVGIWQIIDEGHVTTIAVRPCYRGNQLGEVLLLHLIEQCYRLSVKWLTLEVRETNYSAQNLYYKYGFRTMGVRPKYYQDNQENAFIMTTEDLVKPEVQAQFRKLKAAWAERHSGFPAGYGLS